MNRISAMMVGLALGTVAIGAGVAQGGQPAAPGQAAPADRAAQPKPSDKTVASLQTEYWDAVRCEEFYTRAAKKADEEGVLGVASLFRAAAKVQSVHAGMFTRQLEALKAPKGAAPQGAPLEVKTTAENLAAAVKLAQSDRETDLPGARRAAEGEGQSAAARSMRDAREGEIELARLFKDASEVTDKWKKARRDFYVGRTCGFIVEKLDLTKCPVCGKGRDDFEKVS